MKVGLTGSSGTGKSYIASYIADRYDLPICPVGARSVSAAMGFASPYDVDKIPGKRAEFQLRLFHEKREWEDRNSAFVTDRVHFDNLAYTAMGNAVDQLPSWAFQAYVDATKNYTRIFYLPLRSYQALGNDPQRKDDPTYHLMYDLLLQGLLREYVTNWTALPEFKTRLDKVTQILGISSQSK
jgi:hypothetical protein